MDIQFLSKSANEFASNFTGTYQKPATCPFCGYTVDATVLDRHNFSFNGHYVIAATCKCTSCGKTFFFASEYKKDSSFTPITIPAVSFTPYSNKYLANISERFINMYNQALCSEFSGSIELAAIGYRSALEILVKDFAIIELKEDPNEVSKKTLCNAIGEYLNQSDLVATADVVRILGNDYTHYQRKYPQHDFELLKGYMDIFLKQIEVLYMIKHPPVTRSS